jgi:hypothetical protein
MRKVQLVNATKAANLFAKHPIFCLYIELHIPFTCNRNYAQQYFGIIRNRQAIRRFFV